MDQYALLQILYDDAGRPTVAVLAVKTGTEGQALLLREANRLNAEARDSAWLEYQVKRVGGLMQAG